MLTSLKRFAQPRIIIGVVAVIAVAAVAITYIMGSSKPAQQYVNPTMGTIVQEVDTTGTVDAAQSIDLSFQTSGRIASVNATVGSHVGAGQTLASLDAASLEASIEQAQAGVAAQQAKLASLQAGATPQDLAASQIGVSNAQSSLTQAKQAVAQASQNGYVESDDAIHNRVDQFFQNPRTSSPTLALTLSNSQLQSSIVSGRVTMEALLSQWQTYEASLPSDPDQIDSDAVASTTRGYLTQVSSYLDEVAQGLTTAVPSSSYPTATIQGYETSVATARTNISNALSGLNTAQTAEQAAESGLASAQAQMNVTSAPATQNDIDAQQAAVASAQASLDAAKAQLDNAVIFAPISGTITVNNAKLGETATPGSPVISMISDTQFQMDAFVSQTDLAKVKVGDVAEIDLDAYQGVAFPAHVIAIDPAATLDNNGVASYKVTLQFDANDPRILAGLTGTAKITSQTDQNALSVPTSAIITQGTGQFVLKETPSGDQMTAVTTGISSVNGNTEILSGLSASDRIESFGAQAQ